MDNDLLGDIDVNTLDECEFDKETPLDNIDVVPLMIPLGDLESELKPLLTNELLGVLDMDTLTCCEFNEYTLTDIVLDLSIWFVDDVDKELLFVTEIEEETLLINEVLGDFETETLDEREIDIDVLLDTEREVIIVSVDVTVWMIELLSESDLEEDWLKDTIFDFEFESETLLDTVPETVIDLLNDSELEEE